KEKSQPYDHWQWMPNLPSEIRHLIVVDDDELFLKEMADYLETCAVETIRASSKDEIIHFLEAPDCPNVDTAFIDINLAKNHDYVGFQVAKAIARFQPWCRIIMTTGDPIEIGKIANVAGNLLISGFLYKPFGIEELNHTFAKALAEKPKKIDDFFNLSEKIEEPKPSIEPKPRSLNALVSDLKNEVDAETAILFSIHPLSYEVRIEIHFGIFRDQAEDYSSLLHYSPVKDVALDKEIIFENKITGTSRYSKHRWLVTALHYESCIGCPVTVTQELEYCLFAFHGNEKHFDEVDLFKLKSTADRIAQALEIQRLEETIRNENPFYLTGKTYGSMAHDLVNALNREFGLPAIYKIIADNNTIGMNDKITIREKLESLRSELERAKEIVKNFRRMSLSQHEKETDVDVVATSQKVAKIIKVETDALNTEIIINPPAENSHIPGKLKIKQTPFEQVLYNLFLNAAQQIDRFSFARKNGFIIVEFGVKVDENKEYFQVLIHDSGPGIHSRDFEKIFQKGYTTKEDGCGMGLDICRNILDQAGARIRVLKSILFCGSTFEILLPFSFHRQEVQS
ncbi:MAG TPA: ATP-binding protein, partial [Candidatus Deferrimicrobium sp.]|nr:ATP-binding protein [Candidatus Deferrimicrobium sp.]